MTRLLPALACLFCFAFAPSFCAASPVLLADSTSFEAWRLPNGLEVRVRDVPGASNAAITLAYRAGSFIEPPSRPGLAELLAQLQFMAPAGDIPERSLDEMNSLRPLGWGVSTNAHLALLTEVASAAQFPGVLRQVATRARGVQVGDSCMQHVQASTRRVLAGRSFGEPEAILYERVRDLARGLDEAQILERASGRGLDGLTPAAVDTMLRRLYAPANAVLVLAGDFKGIDLHALLEREFGDIPGGIAQPDPPTMTLTSGMRSTPITGLSTALGAVGLAAPALDDSLHPRFLLGTLLFGSWWRREHTPQRPPFTSYFQFSALDEPELARFDFDVADNSTSAEVVQATWNEAVETFTSLAYTGEVLAAARQNVRWVLGGPLPSNVRRLAASTPEVLATIANGTATRALWRGDAFWDRYRARFDSAPVAPTSFRDWMRAPEHLAILLLHPRR